MRIIIVGGSPDNPRFVHRSLSALDARRRITLISHGCSDPCALPAEAWAWARGVQTMCHPANWDLYGRRAEQYRDNAMLNDDPPDLLLAIGGGRRVAKMKFHARLSGINVVSAGARDSARLSAATRLDAARLPRRVLGALVGRPIALELVSPLANPPTSFVLADVATAPEFAR